MTRNWHKVALEALKKEESSAYDNYYRSKMAYGEQHPTTVGYRKWYDDAAQAVKECEADQ